MWLGDIIINYTKLLFAISEPDEYYCCAHCKCHLEFCNVHVHAKRL